MDSTSRPELQKPLAHCANGAVPVSLKRSRSTYEAPRNSCHLLYRCKLSYLGRLLRQSSSIAYTLFLFSCSDLKTILWPTIIFALLNAPVLFTRLTATPAWIFRQTLQTMLWTWINILLFCFHNQRLPAAVCEDIINKPWRPLPSHRLSPEGASHMLLSTYPLAYLVSVKFGGLRECIVLTALNYLYNDVGGADWNFVIRNLINACGFVCYAAGALRIAVGTIPKSGADESLRQRVVTQWLFVVDLVIFSTIQAQDLRDRIGDGKRHRQTLPVVLGDRMSRWAVVVPIAVWSLLCSRYWQVGVFGHAVVAMVGFVTGLRTLTKRRVEEDRSTFKVWSAWIISIYALPLIK